MYVEKVRGEVGIFPSPKASIEGGSPKPLQRGESQSLRKNQEIYRKYEGNMKKYEGICRKYEEKRKKGRSEFFQVPKPL